VFWDAGRDPVDLASVDAVIHLAAVVGDPGPPEAVFRRVNVDGTARLLDAAGARPVVYVSSASVYAPPVDGQPLTESHPVGGHVNAYGRTKAAGEALALAAGAVVLRPRAVYGPGDPHLLPRLRRAARGGRALLPGPDVSMSLTAVENLAHACLAALDWPAGAYNITDAVPYPRDATVHAVLTALGLRARTVHVPTVLAQAAARLSPTVTRYAVDQLALGVVLDIGRATAQGWRPTRKLSDYLATVGQ
jgi:nucleoside-diphosphate-sugar epimerase